MKWTFKRILAQLFLTHIGRIGVGGLFLIIGGLLSPYGIIGENIYDYEEGRVWTIMSYIGVATLLIEFSIFFTYAWIINPIRDLKERRKNKK